MTLKGKVIKSSLWSLAGGSGQQLIGLVLFLYLAKVLDATAIGIVASAAILSDLTIIAAKMGITESIQRQQEDQNVDNSAFLFTVFTGIIGFFIIVLSAFIFKRYSHDISNVLFILSPVCFFTAVSAVPEGLIKRKLNFRALTIRTWIATFAGGLLAVGMVEIGLGFYALVGQRLAFAIVSCALIWAQADWRPRIKLDISDAQEVIKTGFMILVGNFSGIINARVADSITALFLGPTTLGFLRISSRFSDVMVQMTVAPLASVALPSFSALQGDKASLRRMYLRLTQIMAIGSIPVFFGIGAVAKPFILVVLGKKWLGSEVAMQVLGFAITAGAVNYFFSPLVVAIGRADIVMRQSISQIILGIPLIWFGAQYGLIGVLISNIMRAFLVSLFNLYVITKVVDVKIKTVLGQIIPPFICSLIMFATVTYILINISIKNNIVLLVIGIVSGSVVYVSALVIGDFLGLWRRYVRGVFSAIRGGLYQAATIKTV